MFRVVCFVEDKNLAPVLKAMSGQARGLQVVPVAEVGDQKEVKIAGSGDLLTMFAKHLKTAKGDVSLGYVRAFLRKVGKSQQSAGYLTKKAITAGLIKKHGKNGSATYTRT